MAHPLMHQFHKPADEERMIVILPPEGYDDWLPASAGESGEFRHGQRICLRQARHRRAYSTKGEIMWPFKKSAEKKKVELTKRPIENPVLEAAMLLHRCEPSEKTVKDVGKALLSATFLLPVKGEGLQLTENGDATFVGPGSSIQFRYAFTTDGKAYLPVFTSRSELERWAGADTYSLIQKAPKVWERAMQGPEPMGVVINPANLPWSLEPEHIQQLIDDLREQQWQTTPRPAPRITKL
jgi:SseB protein N-terminal domain